MEDPFSVDRQKLIEHLRHDGTKPGDSQFEQKRGQLITFYAGAFSGSEPPSLEEIRKLITEEQAEEYVTPVAVHYSWHWEFARQSPLYLVVRKFDPVLMPDEGTIRSMVKWEIGTLQRQRKLLPATKLREGQEMVIDDQIAALERATVQNILKLRMLCQTLGFRPFAIAKDFPN